MAQINIDTSKTSNAVIIGFNVTYGNQQQPIYAAGEATIECVVEIEQLAQVQIQKALFQDGQFSSGAPSSVSLARTPSLSLTSAVVQMSYQGASGQAYVVENMSIAGKKG